jgi:hypothetical protein
MVKRLAGRRVTRLDPETNANLLSMSSIRAKFEVSRSNGSRATAPPTDASDNLISPIGWAKN